MSSRILLLLATLPLLACAEGSSFGPTAPTRAAVNASSCELGVSDAAARIKIAALIEQIDAFETSGDLTSGQANALRSHLLNVLRQIDAGNYCAALAQLEAFGEQVDDFVTGGVLTPEQGAELTLTSTQIITGPPNLVTVEPPSAAAGVYEAGYATFGPVPTVAGTSGAIVVVDDGTVNGDQGCNPLVGFPAGAIALVRRGTCTFVDKAMNAQAAGAVAVIVYHNFEDGSNTPINMSADTRSPTPSVTIPIVAVTLAAGETIRAGLPAMGTVSRKPGT